MGVPSPPSSPRRAGAAHASGSSTSLGLVLAGVACLAAVAVGSFGLTTEATLGIDLGTTFSVAMPEHALVSELKRAIGRLRELPYFAVELFIKDVEDALADERPLSSVGRVPLFLLMRAASCGQAAVAFTRLPLAHSTERQRSARGGKGEERGA